jgi:hypothetical protein
MKLNRRFFLRGLFQGSTVVVALPFLDCFLDNRGQALAATGARIPTRFATYFWGCGLTKELYLPKTEGLNYEVTPQLIALDPYRKKINVISGMRAILDDNPNYQHWTGVGAINTGISPSKMNEFDTQTLDLTIAEAIGHSTRFKTVSANCSGDKRESYSSLGGANIIPAEDSPLALYTRLFGDGFQDPNKGDWKPDPRVMVQQSVLSAVADERKRVMQGLGAADKARLDQYFTSVREAEQQMATELQRPEIVAKVAIPQAPEEMPVNRSVPALKKVVPLMAKLGAIGLATDQTRVFNLVLSASLSTIFEPGDTKTFHQQTHEEAVDESLGYQMAVAKFSTYCVEFFADMLKELDGIPEGDGTLLDHSLVLAYTDTSFAKIHAVDGIPMFLAGSASGRVKGGYHIAGRSSPVSRVGLTVQHALGMPVTNWGQGSMATNMAISEILA